MMPFIVKVMLFLLVEVAGEWGGSRMGASPELGVSEGKKNALFYTFGWQRLLSLGHGPFSSRCSKAGWGWVGFFRCFLGVFQLFGGRTRPGGAGPQQALAAMAAAQAPPCSRCSSSLRPRPPHGFGLSWRCRGAIVILLCFISAALRGEEGSRRGCRCGCRGGAARVGAGLQPLARRDAGGAWHCRPCSDRCNMKRE